MNSQNLKASVSFVGDGTTNKFYFGFDYINKQFVKVQIGNEGQSLTYPSDYTVDDRSVVLKDTPAIGVAIRVYRETSSDRIVEWADGAFIKASQMTLENLQQLHLIEEAQDYPILNSLSKYPDGVNFNALGSRVINVSDPKDPQDAVTKNYMETVQGGFVSDNTKILNEAKATLSATQQSQSKAQSNETLSKAWATSTESPDNAEDIQSSTGKTQSSRSWALYGIGKAQEAAISEAHAKNSETNAKASETKALASEQNAKASETNAKASETNAKASETNAKASETNAKASETKALASEQNAKASETNAKASETNANVSETNAKTSETNAKASETNANVSETNAKTSETNAKTSETNAKVSETNAKTSETNAKASETNAKASETNAKSSESKASASASTSASSASASATSATNSHNSEIAAANSAKQAAESAGVFQDFKGATASADGNGGKVPKPLAGQQNKVLKADGTWGDGVTPMTLWNGIHSYPENYVPADLSNNGWYQLGFCSIYYYNNNTINNQPTQYGQLINIPADSTESTQLWIEQSSGRIYSRGGNGQTRVNDTPFNKFATLDEVEQVNGQGSNWIRYKNGLQICWVNSFGTTAWWNFPVAFSSPPVVLLTENNNYVAWVSDLSNTGCKHSNGGTGNGFAIGWWK